MKNNKITRRTIPLLYLTGLLGILLAGSNCNYQWNSVPSKYNALEEKQRGAHVFGRRDSTNFQFLNQYNIEWVTLVAWAGQEDYDSPLIRHQHGDSVQIQQRNSRWLKRVKLAKAAGFKVFIKPHVWLNNPSDGKWRSDIFPTTEENWELWKNSYRDFILRYAEIAQQTNADLFCIGTEFTRLSIEKPDFWKRLIKEIRGVYSGKITYAANWYREYEQIIFWEDLDYIGIQAYFPLVKNEYPSVQQISQGWNNHLSTIESVHKKYKRPILFTELGYKSTADSAIEPWEWIDYSSDTTQLLSMETQANCYEAFFNTVWQKEWLAGVHLWQLSSDRHKDRRGKVDLDFTPLGKPAEKIITKGFEKKKLN